MIRPVRLSDAAAIATIYNYYIEETVITFEEEQVTAEEIARRIGDVVGTCPWLVAEEAGEVAGYAYAGKWKSRCSFRYSVESTVYVEKGRLGRGLGRELYTALIDGLRRTEMHAVVAGISLPNEPSVGLHEKMGFKKVAHFPEVGRKFDRWIDVGYWELLL